MTLQFVALLNFMDPQWLLDRFGQELFWVSAAIVFIECGLLFPILPGDSLLFAMGLFIAEGTIDIPIWLACVLFTAAAFAGNVVGYEIGRLIGPSLTHRDGRILKKKYFDETAAFFDKHGNKALVIGRFVPIVRTFVTVVAGISRLPRSRFLLWSFIGAVLWATGLTLIGYFLGQSFPGLKRNLEIAVILIVLVSVIPMVIEYMRARRKAKPADAEIDDAIADVEPTSQELRPDAEPAADDLSSPRT